MPYLVIALLGATTSVAAFLAFRYFQQIRNLRNRYSRITDVNAEVAVAKKRLEQATRERQEIQSENERRRVRLAQDYEQALAQYKELKSELSSVEESLEDRSFGLYKPHFTYQTSDEYKAALEDLREQERKLIQVGRAAVCPIRWTVHNNAREGERMVKLHEKLLLRAFNAECDAAIANMSGNNIVKMEERIRKSFEAINKLGDVEKVSLTPEYLRMKLDEIRLAHEYEEKRHEEGQEPSPRLAEIDRPEETELNLDEPVETLKEGLAQSPGEPHSEELIRLNREKRDLVNALVAKARLQEERGQFSDALAQWETLRTIFIQDQGLSVETERPEKRRAQQDTQGQQTRRQDLEELKKLEQDAEAASNPAALKPLAERIESISQRYRNDMEFQSAIREIRTRVAGRAEAFEKPAPQATKPSQDTEWAAPVATAIPSGEIRKPGPSEIPPGPAQKLPGTTAPPAVVAPILKPPPKPTRGIAPTAPTFGQLAFRRKKGRSALRAIVGATALMIAVGGILLVPQLLKKRSVTTTSGGAAPPPAPTPSAQTVAPPPPPAQALRVDTDLEHGEISLDGNPAVQLEGGQFNLDDVASGKHTLQISAGPSRAQVDFEIIPGSPPQVTAPVQATESKAVVISSMGGAATIHSSYGPARATLDGRVVGEVGSTPLPLNDLEAGIHVLVLGEGKDASKLAVDIGPAPSLVAHFSVDRNAPALLATAGEKDARKLAAEIAPAPSPVAHSSADRNVGSLLITTGEDNVTVLLNGKKYPGTTKRGQLLIANLEPKTYGVVVQKDGFQKLAPQQTEIGKGQLAKLSFVLQPIPTVASLRVEGAPAAAQVMLDGNLLGTVQPDGTFSASNLKPGDHTVELRKQAYIPKKVARRFAAGELVHLAGSDASMERVPPAAAVVATPLPAKLVVETLPGAQVTLDDRAAGQANPQGRLEVDQVTPGQHTVQVALTGFQEYKQSVSLSSGDSLTLPAGLLFVVYVVHKHPVGSCSGTLIAGRGRIQYRASKGNHSFDHPLTDIKDLGPAFFENAFYIETKSNKRFFFRSASPANDLKMLQTALGPTLNATARPGGE